MKATQQIRKPARLVAPTPGSASPQRTLASGPLSTNFGSGARLYSALHDGPRIVAQRKQLAAMFNPPVQQLKRKEEKLLQGRFNIVQRKKSSQDETVSPTFETRTGLPDQLRSGIESLSGVSLDKVSVHYNSSKPAQLNALAYAQGADIHVAPGQEKHLPHEAWHVVQQAQGRVKPTMQMKESVPVNDDPHLETEADVMGQRALDRKG